MLASIFWRFRKICNCFSYRDFMFLWLWIFKEWSFVILSLANYYNPSPALRYTIVLCIEYLFVDEIAAFLNLCQGTMQNVFTSFPFDSWNIFKYKHLWSNFNNLANVLLNKTITFIKVRSDSLDRKTLAWRTASKQIKFTRFEV